MPVRDEPTLVAHVGDEPFAQGGISSVIRGHLNRTLEGFESVAIASHDPGRAGVKDRIRSFCLAHRQLGEFLRISPDGIVHVHLSQGLSILREGHFILKARRAKVPVVVTIHGSKSLSLSGPSKALYSWLLRQASIVHGFGNTYREYFDVPRERWRKLPNDVVVPDRIPVKSGPARFIFVGAVGERKGVDILLEAWAIARKALPGALLEVVGPDVSGGLLPRRIASLPSVTYAGAVPNEHALRLMEAAHTLVQPSRAEAFPVSVCEALSRGCAVVGTNVGAMGELLEDSGQIVVALDASSVAEGLVRSVERRRGLTGFQFASEKLSTDVVSLKWASLYNNVKERMT